MIVETEAKTEIKACEFKATIGKDGALVIETESEECQKIAMEAAAEHGVDVKHIKPKAVTGAKPTTQ
jgi:DUF1009 family protein